jgi:hypothetical protein
MRSLKTMTLALFCCVLFAEVTAADMTPVHMMTPSTAMTNPSLHKMSGDVELSGIEGSLQQCTDDVEKLQDDFTANEDKKVLSLVKALKRSVDKEVANDSSAPMKDVPRECESNENCSEGKICYAPGYCFDAKAPVVDYNFRLDTASKALKICESHRNGILEYIKKTDGKKTTAEFVRKTMESQFQDYHKEFVPAAKALNDVKEAK